MTSPVPNQESV